MGDRRWSLSFATRQALAPCDRPPEVRSQASDGEDARRQRMDVGPCESQFYFLFISTSFLTRILLPQPRSSRPSSSSRSPPGPLRLRFACSPPGPSSRPSRSSVRRDSSRLASVSSLRPFSCARDRTSARRAPHFAPACSSTNAGARPSTRSARHVSARRR